MTAATMPGGTVCRACNVLTPATDMVKVRTPTRVLYICAACAERWRRRGLAR